MKPIDTGSELASPGTSQFLTGWRYRAVIWSVLLAAVGYLGFALWSGWAEVVHAIGKVGIVGVSIALLLSLLNYGLRFIRWQLYLQALQHPVPGWPSLKIYLAGFALTTTPGKTGEAIRGVLLKQWGVPYPQSLAAFLSERLSDLLAVVVLTLFGFALYPSVQPVIVVGALAVLAVFVVISNERALEMLSQRVSGTGRIATVVRHVANILSQAKRCHAPQLLVVTTLLSVAAWVSEAWAFHLILQWMGLDVPLFSAIFIYAVSMLAGALSFLPGGLGGVEASMTGLLMLNGVGSAEAIAVTIIIRLATLWFAVALGLAALPWAGRHGVAEN